MHNYELEVLVILHLMSSPGAVYFDSFKPELFVQFRQTMSSHAMAECASLCVVETVKTCVVEFHDKTRT